MKRGTFRMGAFALAAALLASVQAGCSGNRKTGPTPSASTSASFSSAENVDRQAATRVITDMTGRRVTIPAPAYIRRVAVQTSPQVLNAYAVGIADKLCAVTNAVKMWKLLTKADPRLKNVPATRAGNAQINIEALLQTNPDVCIGGELDMQAIEKLTKLPTLRIAQGTPGAYFESLRKELAFFGSVFGKESRVRIFDAYLDNALGTVRTATAGMAREKRLKVFMGFDADHLTTYGGGTFMDEWIEASGCLNSAQSIQSPGGREGGLASVSMEQVLGWNPDIVIIDAGKPEDLYNRTAWSALSAVKSKKVYRLPMGIFLWNRPACEAAVLFPQWLALSAYPGRFKGFDIRSRAKRFYSEVFALNFTDDDINQILNP
jgi:iron complex transport system substrate-binding protein